MTTVTLQIGVIRFEGDVLELFGFGEQGSRRIHTSQIEGIELGGGLLGGGLNLKLGRGGVGVKLAFRPSDAERAELEALVAEVRSAIGGGT